MKRPTPNREGWIITNSNFKESELMRFHGIFLTKKNYHLPPKGSVMLITLLTGLQYHSLEKELWSDFNLDQQIKLENLLREMSFIIYKCT